MPDIQYIDTHAHVNFEAFSTDATEVLTNTLKEKTWVINVGSQFLTSTRAVSLAKKFERGVYAAVGLHPIHVQYEPFDRDGYYKLAQDKKVVAIGEIGMDFYRMKGDNKKQQEVLFRDMIGVALELDKPVIIHGRQAYDEIYSIVKEYSGKGLRGVMHCFAGNKLTAKKFLDLGFYISFTGIITFTKDVSLLDSVKYVPSDFIMSETDCPYLAPNPYRGKRNEPLYVRYVVDKIAELRQLSNETTQQFLVDNSCRFFNLS